MKDIKKVIKSMGERYVCHKSNHVKRLDTPLTDSVGTDLKASFERIRSRQVEQPSNVRRIVVAKV